MCSKDSLAHSAFDLRAKQRAYSPNLFLHPPFHSFVIVWWVGKNISTSYILLMHAYIWFMLSIVCISSILSTLCIECKARSSLFDSWCVFIHSLPWKISLRGSVGIINYRFIRFARPLPLEYLRCPVCPKSTEPNWIFPVTFGSQLRRVGEDMSD